MPGLGHSAAAPGWGARGLFAWASTGLQRNFLVPPSGTDPSRKPRSMPAWALLAALWQRERGGCKSSDQPSAQKCTRRDRNIKLKGGTEGQVALSSPRPFPRLQVDNTGHSKVRTDAPTKGKRSCQPRGRVVSLPLSLRAAPCSSPRQVLPAATLSCRALSPRASRALWT